MKRYAAIISITVVLFVALAPFAFATSEETTEEETVHVDDYRDFNQQVSAYTFFNEPDFIYDTVHLIWFNPYWFIAEKGDVNYQPSREEQMDHTHYTQIIFPPGFQEYYEAGNCDVWFDMRHIPSTANNDRIGIYINVLLAQDYADMPIYVIRYNGFGTYQSIKTITIGSNGSVRAFIDTPIYSSIRIWEKGFVGFRYDDTIVNNPEGGTFDPVSIKYSSVYFNDYYVYSYYFENINKDLYSLYNLSSFYFTIYHQQLQGINMDLSRIYNLLQDFGLSPSVHQNLPDADTQAQSEVDEMHSREEALLTNSVQVANNIDVIGDYVTNNFLTSFRSGSQVINYLFTTFVTGNNYTLTVIFLSLFFGIAIMILGKSVKI